MPLIQDERLGAEASTTTVRTVISGAPGGSDGAARGDAAAELLNGFEGVALDAEAEAAIAAALQACAARAREADAAYTQGGAAALDAGVEDPGESFARMADRASPYRGELEPPARIEEFVPFTPDEPHWTLAGGEVPEHWAQWLEEREKGEGEGEQGAVTE